MMPSPSYFVHDEYAKLVISCIGALTRVNILACSIWCVCIQTGSGRNRKICMAATTAATACNNHGACGVTSEMVQERWTMNTTHIHMLSRERVSFYLRTHGSWARGSSTHAWGHHWNRRRRKKNPNRLETIVLYLALPLCHIHIPHRRNILMQTQCAKMFSKIVRRISANAPLNQTEH